MKEKRQFFYFITFGDQIVDFYVDIFSENDLQSFMKNGTYQFHLEEVKKATHSHFSWEIEHAGRVFSSYVDLFQIGDYIAHIFYTHMESIFIKDETNNNIICKNLEAKQCDCELSLVECHQIPFQLGLRTLSINRYQQVSVDELLFQLVWNHTSEGVLITDANHYIEWLNPKFMEITGYTVNEVKGNHPRVFLNDEDDDGDGECWIKTKNKLIKPMWVSQYPIQQFGNTRFYVYVYKELSDYQTIEQKMRIMTQRDGLTGLYDRSYFTEQCLMMMENKAVTELTLLFFDLNRFKTINDALGHQAGDEVLIEFARRLKTLEKDNTLIARYGGDEFVLLLKNTSDKRMINRLIQDLFNLTSMPILYLDHELYPYISIGISMYPHDAKSFYELIQCADLAMYEAKKSPHQAYQYFIPTMKKNLNSQQFFEDAVVESLHPILYEPIYSIEQKTLIGFESKVKENPYINDLKVSLKLFESTFSKVCSDIIKLKCLNVELYPFSVHVPANILVDPSLISFVRKQLKMFSIHPKQIHFDITHQQGLHPVKLKKAMQAFKELGIRLKLNNFNEESPIEHLTKYPYDEVKFSANLMSELEEYTSAYHLFKAILGLVQNFKLDTCMTGVLSEHDIERLKTFNIDHIQGPYFSKPLEFEELIKQLI